MSHVESPDPDTGPSVEAVRERLDRVTDPELDRSIVALEYPNEIDVDGGEVFVEFTLPTAWCSPAFAWMMAVDARDEVEALPGVDRAEIRLVEHLFDEQITEGVNDRRSFEEVFPDADDGVSSVRATLDSKARLSRQYDAFEALLDAGLDPADIVSLTEDDLDLGADGAEAADGSAVVYVRDGAVGITVPAAPLEDYVEKARATGLLADEYAELFRTPEDEPIDPDDFELVKRRCRVATANAAGQGTICDALNESRMSEDRPARYPEDHY